MVCVLWIAQFDVDITGIGFALNRINGDVPVTVYGNDDVTVLASSTMLLGANTTEYNWFGYIGDVKIGKVVVDLSGTSSFWMDDFTVTTSIIPEPATMLLLGLGGLVIRRKK